MSAKLIEGVDYYMNESGLLVFTELYLSKRGYCCKNRCKHCPYGIHEADLKSDKKEATGIDRSKKK